MELQRIINVLMQNSRIFKDFAEEEMFDILQFCKSKSFKDGETILKENTKGSDFFIIVTGSAIIKKEGKVIDVLRSGECFGEMGALSDIKRSASIESKGDTVLLDIDIERLEVLKMEIQLKLYKNIALVLAERLRKRIEDIVH